MKNIYFISLITLLFTSTALAQHEINPSFSEFSITFPEKPTRKATSFIGNNGVDAESLLFILALGNEVFRAEYSPISDPKLLDETTDAQVKQQLLNYMKNNGLLSSHVDVESKGKYRVANGRSTKILTYNGKEIAMTYQHKIYYGRKSVLMVDVIAPSKQYPSEKTMNFINSISY